MTGSTNIVKEASSTIQAQNLQRGSICLFTGCMFSGKTTRLLARLNEYPATAIFACKHEIDDRYSADAIVSHGGKSFAAISVCSALGITRNLSHQIKLVAIDEAHFFDDPLVEVVKLLVDRGVDVMLTGLDRDSWGRKFPLIERIYAMADESVVLQATCARCRKPADRTQRLTPIVDGCMVGGAESYEPRCRMCWHPPPETPPS